MNKLLIAVPVAIVSYGMHRLVKTLKQYSSVMDNLAEPAAVVKPYVPCQCKQFDEDRIHTESVCYPKREGTEDES